MQGSSLGLYIEFIKHNKYNLLQLLAVVQFHLIQHPVVPVNMNIVRARKLKRNKKYKKQCPQEGKKI
jgi:hypothetical protein